MFPLLKHCFRQCDVILATPTQSLTLHQTNFLLKVDASSQLLQNVATFMAGLTIMSIMPYGMIEALGSGGPQQRKFF